ncbi:MAG: hypothetical protein NT092_12065 [Bacteroidia bacterium]|nr:hypothetical protein [Bacteroidia bacterium]
MKKIRSILTGVTALALLINLIGCDKEIPDPPPTVKFYVNGV